MFSLGLLLIVGVVIMGVFFFGRSRPSAPASPPVARDTLDVLERAVAGGLLSREAADTIVRSEHARRSAVPKPSRADRQVPAVAEAIGYVGAILVVVGMGVLVAQFWEDLATWSRLAIVGGVAVTLFVVGLALSDETSPVIWRLRSFVWLLSAAAVAGFTGLLAADTLGWNNDAVAVAVGATTGIFGAALWQLKNRPAQHLTALAGLLVAIGGAMAWLDGPAAVGLAVFAVGTAWLALGLLHRLPPVEVAIGLGTLALLIGPAITAGSWPKAAPMIGLAVAAMLVAAGTSRHEVVLSGFGVAGLFVYLPWALGALFGKALGPTVILLAGGVLLLAVMLVLLRPHGGSGPAGGPRPGQLSRPRRAH